MHIYYGIPYSLEKNLGAEYNRYMELLPNDDDWMVFRDGDTMFLTFDWGHAIAETIEKLPDAGIITCRTNRIRQKLQRFKEDSPDIIVHRLIAKEMDEKFRGQYRKIDNLISGFFMAIKKRTWLEVGKFSEKDGKLLAVDSHFSKKILRAKKSICVMQGLYVFHYYRFAEGWNYIEHLTNAEEYRRKNPRRGMRNSRRGMRNIADVNKKGKHIIRK